jgi:3-oxoacyl-[acyl-carrier protein] reductase
MDLGIAGKTALVTGATRGLGSEIAWNLASEGARVIVASRSETAEIVSGLPPVVESHLGFESDLSDQAGCQRLLGFMFAEGISPDIIVNNVGGNLNLKDPLMDSGLFWEIMKFNLESTISLNSSLIPDMVARGWGRICHVSSISSLENQGVPAYSAAKAAMNAYVRGVGRFVAEHNVILTGVLPGAVFTDGGYWDEQSRTNPAHVERYINERMAIKRFGTPKEIADIVAFLVSDLSSFMVGSLVLADGGQGKVFYGGGDAL